VNGKGANGFAESRVEVLQLVSCFGRIVWDQNNNPACEVVESSPQYDQDSANGPREGRGI
jgi:hypothetical protein